MVINTKCTEMHGQQNTKFCILPHGAHTWFTILLCFVDRAYQYIVTNKTNSIHCLFSVYFVYLALHVSGVSIAHHQEVHRIYTKIGTYCSFQLTVCCPGCVGNQPGRPSDDGLQIGQKHVEFDRRNILTINSASSWFYLYEWFTVFVINSDYSPHIINRVFFSK